MSLLSASRVPLSRCCFARLFSCSFACRARHSPHLLLTTPCWKSTCVRTGGSSLTNIVSVRYSFHELSNMSIVLALCLYRSRLLLCVALLHMFCVGRVACRTYEWPPLCWNGTCTCARAVSNQNWLNQHCSFSVHVHALSTRSLLAAFLCISLSRSCLSRLLSCCSVSGASLAHRSTGHPLLDGYLCMGGNSLTSLARDRYIIPRAFQSVLRLCVLLRFLFIALRLCTSLFRAGRVSCLT